LHESGLTAGLEWLSRRCQEQYDLTVHFHADENCDPPDPVLRDFLFQAARELLFNITKHANTNEAWVSVTCLDKDAVELEVRDAGVGCNVAEIGGPTGDHFGLFAIRERLKLLDGKLEIESGPKGTRVVLSVPIDDDRPATSGAPSEEGHIGFEAPTDDSAEHHRIRVLMADDHPLVREGILTVLQSCPEIEVVGQARDGLEATEAAISLRPDVILMDVSMPRLNGIEATRRIAEALPGARIIALSMHEGRDMARAMLAAGACAYLSKGDGADKVIAAIRAAHAT
jgi:CheY-like chemotaxis protein